jgi:hypothetical protein
LHVSNFDEMFFERVFLGVFYENRENRTTFGKMGEQGDNRVTKVCSLRSESYANLGPTRPLYANRRPHLLGRRENSMVNGSGRCCSTYPDKQRRTDHDPDHLSCSRSLTASSRSNLRNSAAISPCAIGCGAWSSFSPTPQSEGGSYVRKQRSNPSHLPLVN